MTGERNTKGEWRETTLGQLGQIITGKTPSSRNTEYFGGYIPFVTPSDFDGTRLIDSIERHLTPLGANSVPGAQIPSGAVMVTCIGSQMGQSAMTTAPSVTNQQINSIIVAPGNEPLFIYYNLSSRREEIRSLASGSAVPILNKSAFGQLKISLPTLPEQRVIAHILGTLDDKIELNQRMNQTLEEMARAIFQDWFVDFGPVRAKMEDQEPYLPQDLWDLFPDNMADSELRDIPEGWEVGCLGDVTNFPMRSVTPAEVPNETPYIGLGHMPRRSITLPDWDTTDHVTSNKLAFYRGEFLFGKLRPYFHKVGIAPVDGICSTDIVVVSPKANIRANFVLAHISTDEFVAYTDQTSNGTRMPRTNWKTMSQYEICIPTEQIAGAFQSMTQHLFERIVANVHNSRFLAAQRDALLPVLTSGERRLEARANL